MALMAHQQMHDVTKVGHTKPYACRLDSVTTSHLPEGDNIEGLDSTSTSVITTCGRAIFDDSHAELERRSLGRPTKYGDP